jgi:hypothetical protein
MAKLELGRMSTCGYTGGAWPFLVGGLPCQVDSGNERDLSLLNVVGLGATDQKVRLVGAHHVHRRHLPIAWIPC